MVWARSQWPVGLSYTPPVEMMDPSVPPFGSSTPVHAPGLVQRGHSSASYFTPTIFPMANSMMAMPAFSVASQGVPVGVRPDVHLSNLQTGVVCQENVKGLEDTGQEDENDGDEDEWTGIDAQELSGVLARLRMGEGTTTGVDKDKLHLEPHQPDSALSDTTDPSRPSKTARCHVPPPSALEVEDVIALVKRTLRPPRDTGYGYKAVQLDEVLRTRLEMISTFLHLYRHAKYKGWKECSEVAAVSSGRGHWLARHLQEWSHALIKDASKLPTHRYGLFNTSVLDDEDIAQEIILHLQSIGEYFSAQDIVKFTSTPDMMLRLKLKRPIST
jgi:hypothetical protein